jgi:hypothetical protein
MKNRSITISAPQHHSKKSFSIHEKHFGGLDSMVLDNMRAECANHSPDAKYCSAKIRHIRRQLCGYPTCECKLVVMDNKTYRII